MMLTADGQIDVAGRLAWERVQQARSRPRPFLQVDMYSTGELLDRNEVEAFAKRARGIIETINRVAPAMPATASSRSTES